MSRDALFFFIFKMKCNSQLSWQLVLPKVDQSIYKWWIILPGDKNTASNCKIDACLNKWVWKIKQAACLRGVARILHHALCNSLLWYSKCSVKSTVTLFIGKMTRVGCLSVNHTQITASHHTDTTLPTTTYRDIKRKLPLYKCLTADKFILYHGILPDPTLHLLMYSCAVLHGCRWQNKAQVMDFLHYEWPLACIVEAGRSVSFIRELW